jgi:phage tail-like protein
MAIADNDPFVSFHFAVTIPGLGDIGYFTEVSGLEMKIPATKSVVVNAKGQRILRQLPGDGVEYGDIVLKRAVTTNTKIWDWRKQVEEGAIEKARCDGTIEMLDMSGKTVAAWNFTHGWPIKVSGPALTAQSDDVSIEEVTIAHEGLKRDK